jgi:NAD(P)-dependent dehydrogenase (short-subunit alcohol dehydrogenase family)
MFRLDGKCALVTGAGFGMGAGIARTFASQGARVLVNDIDPARAESMAEELRASGFEAMAAPFDVTRIEEVRTAHERIAEQAGPVDILVNNAGNAGAGRFAQKKFAEMAPEDWEPFIAVNLEGVLNCTHTFLPGMCERGWGRIITISSDAGRIAIPIGVSVYGAAKAGAAHMMRHVAVEVAEHGVTANTIALGHMNTIGEPFAGQIVPTIPMGRLGTPQDAAAAAVFLASEEANWITAATLAVNGGSPAI